MSNPSRRTVSVVVPVTSPDVDLEGLCDGYGRPLEAAGYDFEMVFVLDGVQGAFVRAFENAVHSRPVKIVRLHGEGLGESIALSAGAARARGDVIVNAPQYLQSEPDDLAKVMQGIEGGADFVATWRHPRVDPWLNRLQSRFFNWCLRVMMGIRFHDLNSSLRAMRRQVLDEVNVYGEMYRFLPVLAQRQGFRVVEVKVRHREEKGRHGFYGVGVYVRRILDILAITFLTRFTQRPLRFFGMLGFLSMLFGFAFTVEPLVTKFITEKAGISDRPLFVLGVILIAFGFQLIGFGLVGEIIIFTQAKNLRDYKIDEVVEGGDGHEDLTQRLADAPFPEAVPEVDRQPLRVRELVPGEDGRWDSFVDAHPLGTFFHLTGWRRVIEDTFGHEPHYLVAERGRRWVGVLPLFWVKSPFVGRQVISVPYAVYGGVLAADEAAQRELLAGAERVGRQVGATYVELRHLERRPGERPVHDLYISFRAELPATADEVLPSIKKRARAEVRKARDKHGMSFDADGTLLEFFDLFVRDKRRLGSPSLPFRWFRNLVDEFGRQIVIHRAKDQDGRASVAVLSFCYKDVLYAYYSGARDDARGTGANDFVYCELMQWAVGNGYRLFDFGRSRRDSGAAAFKKNMGFEPTPLRYEYVLLTEDARLPNFTPSNPRLERPRRIWSRMPLFATSSLGGWLSRYLP